MTMPALVAASSTNPDWQYEETFTPDPPVNRARYGSDVAISGDGDTLVTGAPVERYRDQHPGFAEVYERAGDEWEQTAHLTGDADFEDDFGLSVAIQDDVVFVGAPDAESSPGVFAGAVYVYERSTNGWERTQKLTNGDVTHEDDGWWGDGFGGALAVDGDRLLVGAYGDESNGDPDGGAVYAFEHTRLGWVETATLTPDESRRSGNSEDWGNPVVFGIAVALRGDTALVGAPGEGGGAVYAFERTDDGWNLENRLKQDKRFGSSVALDAAGDTAAIGAPSSWYASTTQSIPGWVYVYQHDNGTWTEQTNFSVPEGDAEIGDNCCEFGESVAISASGLRILAGAPKKAGNTGTAKDPEAWAGAAYVFDRSTDGWTPQTKLTAPEAHKDKGDTFGEAVAMTPGGGASLIGASEYWRCGDPDCGAEGDNGEAHLFRGPPAPWRPTECVEGGPISGPVHQDVEPAVGDVAGDDAEATLHDANCNEVRDVEKLLSE